MRIITGGSASFRFLPPPKNQRPLFYKLLYKYILYPHFNLLGISRSYVMKTNPKKTKSPDHGFRKKGVNPNLMIFKKNYFDFLVFFVVCKIFKQPNSQIFKNRNFQNFKLSNIQISKHPRFQNSKFSKIQNLDSKFRKKFNF